MPPVAISVHRPLNCAEVLGENGEDTSLEGAESPLAVEPPRFGMNACCRAHGRDPPGAITIQHRRDLFELRGRPARHLLMRLLPVREYEPLPLRTLLKGGRYEND